MEILDYKAVIDLSGILPVDTLASVATFGENLKRVRYARHPFVTQTALAALLGHKNNSTISKWETSGVLPEPATIRKVAEALEVAPGELTLGVEDKYDELRGGATEGDPIRHIGAVHSTLTSERSDPHALPAPAETGPPYALTGFASTEAVVRLLAMSEELAALAEAILHAAAGGHPPAPRRASSKRPVRNRTSGRKTTPRNPRPRA